MSMIACLAEARCTWGMMVHVGNDGAHGEEVGSTSDDANPGAAVSSCLLAGFPCGRGRSSIGKSASCVSSLLSTSSSHQRCDGTMLLVRLDGIPSSAEITSCVRFCGSCDVVGRRESMSCAAV